MLRCLSVVYDEGLRSYKAIAFIRGNPNNLSIKPKSYLYIRRNLFEIPFYQNKKPLRGFSKNLGEKLWIK